MILAAERAERTDFDDLDTVKRMAAPADFEQYRRADSRFHIGVAEAARSPRLVTEMTEVQGRMSDLIGRIAHPEEVLTHSNAQHRRLVRLLRERDAGRAVPVMRTHIRGTEHILAGLLWSAEARLIARARRNSPLGERLNRHPLTRECERRDTEQVKPE